MASAITQLDGEAKGPQLPDDQSPVLSCCSEVFFVHWREAR